MTKHRYILTFEVTTTVVLDEDVIKHVDEEWRKELYNLKSEKEIVGYIITNLMKTYKLTNVEGFCDLDKSLDTSLESEDWELSEFEKHQISGDKSNG